MRRAIVMAMCGAGLAGCGGRAAPPPPAVAVAVVAPPVPPPPPAPPPTHAGCDGATLLGAADALRDVAGPWPVGARTVDVGGLTVEVWYPARPGSARGAAPVRYDLRTRMPPAEAAKIPDADNVELPCACVRDLPLDDGHGPYPAIVFLHGAASFRAQSAFLTAHWASRGFVVVAPDLPGVGLLEALGGAPTGFPLDVPRRLLDALAAAPGAGAADPLAFVRGRLDGRVAIAGHSLGALLANAVYADPAVAAIVSMAGAAAPSGGAPALILAGDHDRIVAYAARRGAAVDVPGRRFVGLRGAGHLAFSDLCTVGAERGGAFAIAVAHGVAVPGQLADLAQDGCRPGDAPFAITAPLLRAATAAFLEEHLQCADAGATWRALAARPELELISGQDAD